MATLRIPLLLLMAGVAASAEAGEFVPAVQPPIENQYIVVLKGAQQPAPARAAALSKLAGEHGGKFGRGFKRALNGGVMTMSMKNALALAKDPRVAYVEQDAVIQLVEPAATTTQDLSSLSNFYPWGLDRIDQRTKNLDGYYGYNADGDGVTAYVIDTGIRYSHAEFAGRATAGYDAFGGNAVDCNGHGTHVAGTVGGNLLGAAKQVALVGVRVLDCNGSGSISGVIGGLDWVASNAARPAVANMSLGGGASVSLDTAVKNTIAAGITTVVAAGNNNTNPCSLRNTGQSPARVAEAVTVGATTSSDSRASYSNYGACLDVFAPGSAVWSAWASGDYAVAKLSGTSMAAPHVAGAAALYLQDHPNAAPAEVANAIIVNATAKVVTSAGKGSPNRLLYSLF